MCSSREKEWSEEIYQSTFSKYFRNQRELYDRFQCTNSPITDSELEMILTTIPLDLFTVAEKLSEFKVSQEVTKLRVKQIEKDEELFSDKSSETKRKEEASFNTLEHKLIITVQNAIVDRVEREMSFSRELIMGAKKIWDSRRTAEDSLPIRAVSSDVSDPDLPG